MPAKDTRTSPALFLRQIIAELRKVIWPTRKELITYTTVALSFIVIMIGIVTDPGLRVHQAGFRVFGLNRKADHGRQVAARQVSGTGVAEP